MLPESSIFVYVFPTKKHSTQVFKFFSIDTHISLLPRGRIQLKKNKIPVMAAGPDTRAYQLQGRWEPIIKTYAVAKARNTAAPIKSLFHDKTTAKSKTKDGKRWMRNGKKAWNPRYSSNTSSENSDKKRIKAMESTRGDQ